MAERKRRGLGRGLGALINSDAQEAEAAEAQKSATTGDNVGAEHGAEQDSEPAVSVSRETSEARTASPRPIDVFFSAKSDLDRQVIARESATISRPSTASRRVTGGQRAPMPDVLSRNGAKPSAPKPSVLEDSTPSTQRPAPEVTDIETQVPEDGSPSTPEGAWTGAVSRETGGSVDGAEFRSIRVDSIVPNPRQPRQEFDEEHMDELIHSIREIGVLQPIVVRPAGPDHFELVMGERRWRASKAADRDTVPAIVRMTADDDLLRDALLENIHRSQLNPLEEAAAYRQLLDDFNCTQDELAERIGRSRPQISNTLRLMKLPPAVQRRVAAGVLSAGHARALLGLKSQEQMDQLAGRIVAEGLSVRATEEAVTLAQRDQGTGDLGRERAKSPRVRQLEEFSDALTDRLDTQVKITLGAKKGRIAIDFGSIDDLHRLMEMIGSRS
ncbi:ParB/RepB/Spo0J family partition protein [Nesterenkonia sp. CF4.4]|uniref:ParB/RepB/Spo0J family partition protein n=1 Tax=Nesterenkonia sp. CF4.4 TaxID=3373079 RepID=UPI003EE5DD4B